MKKTYEKPMIMFESFASSVNIAGDCEVKTDTQARGMCGIPWGTGTLFLDIAGSDCAGTDEAIDPAVGEAEIGSGVFGDFDSICYHVPQHYNTLFNS